MGVPLLTLYSTHVPKHHGKEVGEGILVGINSFHSLGTILHEACTTRLLSQDVVQESTHTHTHTRLS